jgi:hypothetical protein
VRGWIPGGGLYSSESQEIYLIRLTSSDTPSKQATADTGISFIENINEKIHVQY